MKRLVRFQFRYFLMGLALTTNLSCEATEYFYGQIKFEINGETVEFSRLWKCDYINVFRPGSNDLISKLLVQKPVPAHAFVVKRFGKNEGIVFDNWKGCDSERRWAGDRTVVHLVDSLDQPNYGERIYLKSDEPEVTLNSLEKTYKVRLVSESVVRIDEARYAASESLGSDDLRELTFRLRLGAPKALTVHAVVFNKKDKTGLDQSAIFTKSGWKVDHLRPPKENWVPPLNQRPNLSLMYLPLEVKGKEAGSYLGSGLTISYANRLIELDERGSAKMFDPLPGIRMVLFFTSVDVNPWAQLCRVNPPPECPKIPASSR